MSLSSTDKLEFVLPKNLRALMLAKNLSYIQLSRLSGVPRKTLYHWTSGQGPRNLTQVYAVSRALGVSIEELAFGITESHGKGQISYELVLYRITDQGLREKATSLIPGSIQGDSKNHPFGSP